jgi:tetratricopeptide (TPR) repeat protein
MALGFGFNKAKVLASAEKNVQQGKLNNAITEYEKIADKDPKDLTVLNTIGDLYARLGKNEKAGEFFKRVGDTYAADGFTVKAIAMYKKLTKVNPGAISVIQRLAELYTQQGLYNDARQQYLVLADNYVKSNDVHGAARIFQKMLEIDPDNASLQSKLADLHVKVGKKAEAREIFLRAATSLYERGSVQQATEALERMLSLDPQDLEALFMRGKIALEANDGPGAVKSLEKVPNIDSRADGLQALLKGYLLSADAEHAEGVARKLLTVHNDVSGVRAVADHLTTNGKSDVALNLYEEFVDRLVVGDSGQLTLALQNLTGQLKDSTEALEKLRTVFQKAGAAANIPEVNELLAHACVKAGNLAKARDLYKELADIEPSNPQHMQNYRQVQKRMGDEPITKPLSANEGAQALFVEEIDTPLPTMPDYPPALQEKIATVLADSELFESYNKPLQALKPLEAIIEKAPRDFRINQRLASVYARLARYEDAARCCTILQEVYGEAGLEAEAKKYSEMATRFREEAGIPEPETPVIVVAKEPATKPASEAKAPAPPAPVAHTQADTAEFEVLAPVGEAHEIDLSSEWEAATADTMEFAVTVPEKQESTKKPAAAKAAEPEVEEISGTAISDLLDEIKFYLSQQMWEEARSAIKRVEKLAPANFELPDLKAQLDAGMAAAAPAVEDGSTVVEYDFETELAAAEAEKQTPESRIEEAPVQQMEVAAPVVEKPEPVVAELSVEEIEIETIEPVVEELEPVVEEIFEPPVEEPPVIEPEPEPEPVAAVAAAPANEKDVLSELVLDLEDALGIDFGETAPVGQPSLAAAAVATAAPAAPHAAAVAAAPAVQAQMADASSVLSELFEEFKEEVGEAAEEKEDPDTHYNLGVAFKEMGLLDEAIGELQKVCKAIDTGAKFSQVMQAYTWLANCFVEKGVPEAAVKWYEKALSIPSSPESQTALHYDLASTYEAAGDRSLALKHFTEVYGTNIDYRDVAQRIKALKS